MITQNKISVLGAGGWGTALSQAFAHKQNVTLYARSAALAKDINAAHCNALYLPATPLSENIRATANLAEAVSGASVLLLATPAQHLRPLLAAIKPHLAKSALLVNCAKGIEVSSGQRLSEVAQELVPEAGFAVLSGPTFAHEVAQGLPAAATLALSYDAEEAATALSSRTLRLYPTSDVIGAEIGGAAKNVIAIACGIVAGKKLGENARAAVMTRGMAEIKRFGLNQGARAETFLGLSGIGDLTLTCHSAASRNYSLGKALGEGQNLEAILAARRTVAEGVATAKAIAQKATAHGIDMPICTAIDAILHKSARVDDVIAALLTRDIRIETE